jgi:opacity protein-like surface antigen
MRKLSLIALFVLVCGTFAVAQESKGEFFAGYSYLHVDCGSGCTEASWPAGFNVDGTYYFANSLGLTADFQYNHKGLDDLVSGASGSAWAFHAGPRFKARNGKFQPFVHALFGITHVKLHDPNFGLSLPNCGTVDCSDNAFSMKLGGGLDVGFLPHLAIRVGEFNYYFTKFDDTFTSTSPIAGAFNGQSHQNNFTFSAGIVLH